MKSASTFNGPSIPARERLLDAAEQLFARAGYAGTSVREITREAGCNVAAVNYHFGGKLDLYRQVFVRRLELLREQRIASVRRAVEASGGSATVEEVLRAFANAFLEPLVVASGGRLLVLLLGRELLDPQLEPDLFLDRMIGPIREVLVDALVATEPAVGRGSMRMCVESFVAQLTHVLHLVRFTEHLSGRAGPQPDLVELVDHIVQFTAAGIRGYAEGTAT